MYDLSVAIEKVPIRELRVILTANDINRWCTTLKKFKSIYENLNLNLNWRLLDNAISEIECYKDCIHVEWKLYKEIMKSRLSYKGLREGVEKSIRR